MPEWREKVVLVTGGSSGLGLRDCGSLGAAGAGGDCGTRRRSARGGRGRAVRRGCDVTAIAADLTDAASVEALVSQVIARFGRLDVLVNNAGRSSRRAVLDTTPEDFQRSSQLNLLGVVRVTRACAEHLLAARGHVVNIGSLAAKSAARFMGAYPASKFAAGCLFAAVAVGA